ncbi:site-specific integrase [Streptococcus acidominimus]|uniref:site-specific integrase n=1 Tax=Streptococcus acidominimus TaxID=1326 RepID=UPI00143048D6|nr:site-specific integrase [Streptococcus acidominimus]MBF0818601.1 site-specific integrase [Streptococcus acidominimus]MBF0838911.1 site-specific integrase [Streptococcus acidominimus]MBF0847142.1 site-specific integrase [Streptococcus danieliae]
MIKPYHLKDGAIRYYFITYVGIDPLTGKEKRVKKSGFKTMKEAKLAESQLLIKVEEDGYFSKPDKVTFLEVYQLWLEHYKNTVKASTYARQKAQADLHIIPIFGACYVDKIGLPMCQKQALEWFKKYKKYANFIGMTKSVLDYAVSLGYIQDNPMRKIIKPRKTAQVDEDEKKAENFYSRDQLLTFLDCVEKEDYLELTTIFRLLAFTGMRKSEVLALRWKDIDFSTSKLSVNQTVAYGENNAVIFQTPKTKKSKRTISLDPTTVKILKKWRQERQFFSFPARLKDTDILFPTEKGKPRSFDFINYHLKKILDLFGNQM